MDRCQIFLTSLEIANRAERISLFCNGLPAMAGGCSLIILLYSGNLEPLPDSATDLDSAAGSVIDFNARPQSQISASFRPRVAESSYGKESTPPKITEDSIDSDEVSHLFQIFQYFLVKSRQKQ